MISSTRKSPAGQAMVELVLSAGAILLTIASAGWILKLEWDRARCAHLVFEKTRAALNHTPLPPTARIAIEISEDASSITGQSQCGKAHEKVRLKKL